jgi:hypothetical protein
MPIGALPIDSDVPNSSSIYQPLKECLDWIGYLSNWAAGIATAIASAISAALAIAIVNNNAPGATITASNGTISNAQFVKVGTWKQASFLWTVSSDGSGATAGLFLLSSTSAITYPKTVQATVAVDNGTITEVSALVNVGSGPIYTPYVNLQHGTGGAPEFKINVTVTGY